MTKQTFLKRLKKMLTKYPDDACGHCPGAYRYCDSQGPDFEICKICQGLMGLSFKREITHYNREQTRACPCHRLTPQEALSRAWEVINAYEAEHGSLT